MVIPKVNLNALARPKIFWPTMVILLTLCVIFYAQKEKEKSIRITKETELLKTIEAKKVVENSLEEAKKKIAERDEQINLTLDRLEKAITARKDAEDKLLAAINEKKVLEEKIAGIAARSPNIELEKIVVNPGSK